MRLATTTKLIVMAAIILVILIGYPTSLSSNDIEPVFKGHKKMGLGLKESWRTAMYRGDLQERVSCLVGLGEIVNDKIVDDLKDAGLDVKTVLKTVIAGTIEIGDLPFLVALDSVNSVDLGKRLMLK